MRHDTFFMQLPFLAVYDHVGTDNSAPSSKDARSAKNLLSKWFKPEFWVHFACQLNLLISYIGRKKKGLSNAAAKTFSSSLGQKAFEILKASAKLADISQLMATVSENIHCWLKIGEI